jgi:phenylalanyl-tRNA synthetase beta chain
LRYSKVNEILGTTLSAITISRLLRKFEINENLQPKKKNSSEKSFFTVPTFRNDIEREIDLIEEVARGYGYNNIETEAKAVVEFSNRPPSSDYTQNIKTCLIGSGFQEIICNSMQEASIASIISDKYVKIANPISNEMAALRTSLVPGVLQVIKNNIFHGNKNLRLFEVGRTYFHDPASSKRSIIPGYIETETLMIAMTGSANSISWDKKGTQCDIFDLKGEIETIFKKIFLDKYKFIPYSSSNALTELGLHVEINGVIAGMMAKISSQLLHRFEVEQDVFIAEINLLALENNVKVNRKFRTLSKYPSVMRDLAFIVDEKLAIEKIENEILYTGKPLLMGVKLFDIYVGDQVSQGKKSVAFALEFMSEQHTLKQEEVDQVIDRIIHNVSTNLNATLRG